MAKRGKVKDGGIIGNKDIIREVFDKLVDGVSRPEIKRQIAEKYDISIQQANKLVQKAYKQQIVLDEKELCALRFLQLNRLERVYNECINRRDYKSAVQAADIINKLFSLYETKHKVEITKDVIQFKFAEFNEAEIVEDAQVVAEVIIDEDEKYVS